jgi:tyrosyl-tRNA synthetase
MESWEGAQLNKAKEILAFELTKLVHGEDEAKRADETAKSIFTGGDAENMPVAELSNENFKDGGIDIVSLVFAAGLATSKSDARRAVEQGGVSVNGEKVAAIDTVIARDIFNEGLVLKKGKKSFKKVVVK